MEKEKMTKSQEMLVKMLEENLDKGYLWEKGWKGGKPMSFSGSEYSGQNALLLTLVTWSRGYSDNRWMTFNAMKKAGYSFKRDEDGKCLGTGAGVPVEYFQVYDKNTKTSFSRSVLDGMTDKEAKDYMRENVITVRRAYTVFNCSIINGIPEIKTPHEENVNERLDAFIEGWSKNECAIVYGGGEAAYNPAGDEIYLPSRDAFVGDKEFYGTALHEIAHSTGAKKRLGRDLSGIYGTESYAKEELIAEIASLFICEEFGTEITECQVKNSAAYIDSWKKAIKETPEAIFKAITEAAKINKYLVEAEENFNSASDGRKAA